MRVLFVHSEQDTYSPEKPIENLERMQFGISYISSVLKDAGHETRLVVPVRGREAVVDRYVSEFEPGLICFTAVYSEFEFIARLAARVKASHPEIFLIAGGPHASLKPEECIGSAFDAVCVGEGEYPTLELVEQLEADRSPASIPNLHIRRGDRIEKNPPRPFIQDLYSLPFPDREMWLPWTAWPESRPSLLVGRGCPFQCTYCCNHALLRLAPGRYVRMRSPGNIVAELQEMKAIRPGLTSIYLEVETLGVDLEWALELCSELERFNGEHEVPVAFGSNLRVTPNTDYDELFAGFARANFDLVNIGIESGSERVRREVLKRNYSNDDIIRAVRTARKHGLLVGTYNLIGIPGETKADFRETVRVNRICEPDWYLLSVFFPYPGTELHSKCQELGLLENAPDCELERRRPVLDLPGFSKRQVKRRFAWSAMLMYGGRQPMVTLLWLVVMNRIFATRRFLTWYRKRQAVKYLRYTRLAPEAGESVG